MITAANKSRREKGAMQTLYFNTIQTKEILGIAGDAGLVLLQHYVAIAHQPNPNMEDAHLAAMLDKTTTTVRDLRLKLTKAEWFKRIKVRIKGTSHIMYLVGKEAVQNHHSSAQLAP